MKFITFFLTLLLFKVSAWGAVINVGAGESIQSAINSASNGDVIVLSYPGQYTDDLNITSKSITIRSTDSANTGILGNIVVSAIPTSGQVNFVEFSVSGTIDVNGSGRVVFQNMTVQENLSLQGISDCFIKKSTFAKTISMPQTLDDSGNPSRLAILQSTVSKKVTSKASKNWLGYSNFKDVYLEGTIEVVGNNFHGQSQGGIGIDLNASHSVANIHNNIISHFSTHQSADISEEAIGIRVAGGAKAHIINNWIYSNYDTHNAGTETLSGIGVFVKNTADTKIINNMITNNYIQSGTSDGGSANIWAPSDNVIIGYNGMTNSSYGVAVGGGGTAHNSSTNVSFTASQFLINTTHGGANLGHPDGIYQDHDGSRANIGPNGGCRYIPNGRTTNKAIPISFSATPETVPSNGQLSIKSAGATVK